MTTAKLDQFKKFTTVSFAVWPFDPQRDAEKIHTHVVILGLNPSKEIEFGQNFHTGRRYDRWYEEAFSNGVFSGALMTDLIFEPEPDSSVVTRKWKRDEEFKLKQTAYLTEQFDIAGIDEDTPILCIGKNTKELFTSTAALSRYKNIYYVPHPNGIRIKSQSSKQFFLSELELVKEKIGPIGHTQ